MTICNSLLFNCKLKTILAVLLLFAGSFAWNTKGLVDCNGLFLLDQKERQISGYGCFVSDSTQVENWMVQGGYGLVGFEAGWIYEGMNVFYTWTLTAEKDFSLGYAAVQTDFRHLNFRVDVMSLPVVVLSTHWNTLDSVLFAGAYYGRGEIDSLYLRWESAAKLSIIPVVEGAFEDEFEFRRFNLGTKLGNHRISMGFTYGDTDPVTEYEGYVFSDSSTFWAIDPSYTYSNFPHEFSADYYYVYADQNAFALLREDGSEKRFFYLPIGWDINIAYLKYRRYSYADRNRDARLEAHALYGQVNINVPWEERRFYETMAPNRALTSSIIKTLSFSVFNRSFRVYGVGEAKLADTGAEYDWDIVKGRWHLKPRVGLDIFYMAADVELQKRTETSNMLYADHYTDTLTWDLDVVGSMLGLGFGVESPKRHFFTSLDIHQVIPFYYSLEKYPPVIQQVVIPEENPEEGPVVEDVANVSENDVSNVNKFFRLFRNGFMIRLKVGLFF